MPGTAIVQAIDTGLTIREVPKELDNLCQGFEYDPSVRKNGDSVDYYISSNGNRPHSAVVYNKASGLFVSKWGLGGLYVHKPTKTPYNGGDVITKEFGYYRP